MYASMKIAGFIAALAGGASAAHPSPSNIWATSDVQDFVSDFFPSATSVSPSQLSAIYKDVNNFETTWENAQPTDPLQTDSTIPASLYTAIESAEFMALATPSIGIAEISSLASGLPESAALMAYETSLAGMGEVWTTRVTQIIASDLGLAVATSSDGPSSAPSSTPSTATTTTSSSSGLAAAPTVGSGLVAGAVAAAAGVVGIALL